MPIEQKHMNYANGKLLMKQTHVAGFLRIVYRYLCKPKDECNEWDNDVWDVKQLKQL